MPELRGGKGHVSPKIRDMGERKARVGMGVIVNSGVLVQLHENETGGHYPG
jgi:hypothetical protein